jgi:hypothetical protein
VLVERAQAVPPAGHGDIGGAGVAQPGQGVDGLVQRRAWLVRQEVEQGTEVIGSTALLGQQLPHPPPGVDGLFAEAVAEDEAVPEPGRAPERGLGRTAEPDRDRVRRGRVNRGPVDLIELAGEADRLAAPQLAQVRDLLV